MMARVTKPRLRVVLGVVAVGLALAAWAFLVEPSRLVTTEVTLAPPGWPAELSGLKVAVIADLHVGAPFVDAAAITRVRAAIDAWGPDVVLLAGDLLVGHEPGAREVGPDEAAKTLAGWSAPLGVHAVLGNHDWWVDGAGVTRALKANGVAVLENEAAPLTFRSRRLWLAGLADVWTRAPDASAALRDVPEGEPVIAFTHNPDVFPSLPARFAVVFAGHTHGGQVRLPLVGAPVVPSKYKQRYVRGEVREEGRLLFVTSGVGTSILPVRFAVPPEVALVTLVSAH
jgi:predicted MPP superfamily phosphohydrolase